MIFSSFTYIVFFAAVVVLLLANRSNAYRKIILLLASYVFYGWWDPRFLTLIIASSLIGYSVGILLSREHDSKKRLRIVLVSIGFDLGILGYFKYFNFFAESFSLLFGIQNFHVLKIMLPVGISFYTFQSMSYSIDVYRKKLDTCHSLPDFLLFIAFFPQLVAGPIVRAADFLPQLKRQIGFTSKNIIVGCQVFLLGFMQKKLFADNLAIYVDEVFKNSGIFSASTHWIAIIAYSFQILCDFSGYSLMAIGSAKILGFDFMQNFNYPYLSSSLADFWRRWHISLSSWLRDYLYITLGGNRQGRRRTSINLFITMLLGGLWHGAGWNFVAWGGVHGVGLMVNRRLSEKPAWVPGFLKRTGMPVTFLFVLLAWVLFRSGSFNAAMEYYRYLFVPNVNGIFWYHLPTLIIIGVILCWHAAKHFRLRVAHILPHEKITTGRFCLLLLLFSSIVLFAPTETSPFIYFQF